MSVERCLKEITHFYVADSKVLWRIFGPINKRRGDKEVEKIVDEKFHN